MIKKLLTLLLSLYCYTVTAQSIGNFPLYTYTEANKCYLGLYDSMHTYSGGAASYRWSLAKLKAYLTTSGFGTGTVTSIANGYGILGGTITTTGTLRVDSSKVATRYYVGANFYPLTGNPSGFLTSAVTSVSGTSNRITSTGGATPVIDISASYVGQSSITTLGTIGTGTWQGTAVSSTYGGTGLNTSASSGIGQVTSGTWSVAKILRQGTFYKLYAGGSANTATAETWSYSTTIAANTLQAGDILEVMSEWKKVNTNGTFTVRVRFGTNNSTADNLIATYQGTSSTLVLALKRKFVLTSSTTLYGWVNNVSFAEDIGITSSAGTTTTVNLGVTNYLSITIQNASASDTTTPMDSYFKIF